MSFTLEPQPGGGFVLNQVGGAQGPAAPAPIAAGTVSANPTASPANPIGVDGPGIRALIGAAGTAVSNTFALLQNFTSGINCIANNTDIGFGGTDNYIGGITNFRSPSGIPSGTTINGTTGVAVFGGALSAVGDLRLINVAVGSTATPSIQEIEFRFGNAGGPYLAGLLKGKGYASNVIYADLAMSANASIIGPDNLPDDVILRGQTGNLEIVRGSLVMSNATKLGIRTIATLPSAASSSGDRYQVSNSATVGNRIAFSNGTDWYYEGTAVAV